MLKWIIYLGGNSLDVRIIKSIRKNGFKLILVDRNIKSPCIKNSDIFINQDINSRRLIFEEINQKLKSKNIIAILESGEFAIQTAAYLRTKFNIEGLHTKSLKKYINKIHQKHFFNKFGIKNPSCKLIYLEELLKISFKEVYFPCVVKIPESSGGNNVWICKDNIDFDNSIKDLVSLDYKQKILIEDFIDGLEISVSGIICNNIIHDFNIFEVQRKTGTGQLETGILCNNNFKNKTFTSCYELLLKIAKKCKFNGGIISANLILCKDQIYCIEFTSLTSQLLLNAQELFLNRNMINNFLCGSKNNNSKLKLNSKSPIFGFKQLFNNDPIFENHKNINLTKEFLNSFCNKNFLFIRDLNTENLNVKQIINLAVIFVFAKDRNELLKEFEKYRAIISDLIESSFS
tara:strand:- start:1315 stop:2523 length:1209 start_codon:yes stop_codon:yes gene_type:complete